MCLYLLVFLGEDIVALFHQQVFSSLDNMHTVDNIAPCVARCYVMTRLLHHLSCDGCAMARYSVCWTFCHQHTAPLNGP